MGSVCLRGALALLVCCLCIPCAFGDHELTGTWSGTLNATDTCNDRPLSYSSPVTLHLTQSGTSFAGNGVVHAVNLCGEGTAAVGFAMVGTLTGSSYTALSGLAAVSGTVSGESMSFTVAAPGLTMNASLVRTSRAAPASALGGAYAGAATYFVTCPNGTFSVSLPLGGSVAQTNDLLVGSFRYSLTRDVEGDAGGNCRFVASAETGTIHISGRVSGSTVSGVIFAVEDGDTDDENDISAFTGSVSGTTITGRTDNAEPSVEFAISRTSATPGPVVANFVATPGKVSPGQSSMLSWATTDAASVSIEPGIGVVAPSGTKSVAPPATTTYTLTASGAGGTTVARTTLTVEGAGIGPEVVITRLAAGMLEVAGEGAANDFFTIANQGSAEANVTLARNGGFYTISHTALTLAPGESFDVAIRSNSPQPNTYEGAVFVNGSGVPPGLGTRVRMLVVAAPPGPVSARAASTRAEIAAPAGQNPSGSVSFTNTGSNTLQGIAVSDVAWATPQGGLITIPPGQTQQVNFATDRTRRPDGSSPSGGTSGKITLRFLSGGSATGGAANDATTLASAVSVSIVDVVRPSLTSGGAPPLAPGEVAYFIPGFATRDGTFGDLLMAHGGATPAGDVRVFFSTAAGSVQSFLLPLAPDIPVAFPSIGRSVFGISGPTGSIQIRAGASANLSVGAVQSVSSQRGLMATALPVLRSDRAAAAGQRLVLGGLEPGSDLFIQEVAGSPATLQVDSFDRDGRRIASRAPDALQPFGHLEVTDVPAVSVRITNTSSAGGRIAAYGLVRSSGDAWAVTDSSLQAGERFVVPMTMHVPHGATASSFQATVTSASEAGVTPSFTTGRATPARNRAAGTRAPGGGSAPLALGPMQSATVDLSAPGFVIFTVAPASVSIGGRMTVTVPGQGTFGSGVSAIPAGGGIASGETRRFTGVDDASPATVLRGTPGTYRSSLVLIEISGKAATARVTLRFGFAAGTAAAGLGVAAKDFQIGPNQMLVISDLARSIIGAPRDQLGDLRNMLVDVAVVSGEGRVVPLVQSVENATGDTVQRE